MFEQRREDLAGRTAVRLWPVAIAASLAAHAAFAFVMPARQLPAPVIDEPEPPPAPEPIAVAVVTFESPAPVTGGSGGGGVGHGATAITTTARAGGETPAAPGAGTPAGHAMMAMHRPSPLAPLPEGFIDDFLLHSKPRELLPDERIDEDIQAARHAGDWERLHQLREEKRRLDLQPSGHGTYKADKNGFDVDVARDGTTHIKDKPTFDATDAAMRAVGIDPYASAKLKVLDRTRDTRAILQKRARKHRLAHSAQLMQGHIDRLWHSTRDLAARKQGLFELWDDCEETGDDDVLAGAVDARHTVLGWIQLELVGADAYTPEELARLNAKRRSQARFEPYLDDR
jgi:hypothetical protein